MILKIVKNFIIGLTSVFALKLATYDLSDEFKFLIFMLIMCYFAKQGYKDVKEYINKENYKDNKNED